MGRTFVVLACAMLAVPVAAQRPAPDSIPAAGGAITVQPLTHATLQITQGSHIVLIDPTIFTGYDGLPQPVPISYGGLKPPTLILVTDEHSDHFDAAAIGKMRTPATKVVTFARPPSFGLPVQGAIRLANGQMQTVDGVAIEAVPMYNLQRGFQGELFHTKGRGNGYVVTLGGKRLYVAGDTECTPEMKALRNIDVAFLPMNLPYTMTPAEAADCAKAFKPKIVYPYHYRGQDPKAFAAALKGSGIEVRLRDWYPGAPPFTYDPKQPFGAAAPPPPPPPPPPG